MIEKKKQIQGSYMKREILEELGEDKSAELFFKVSREMLKGFEMEEDGGYR